MQTLYTMLAVPSTMELPSGFLFSEPSGQRTGLIQFSGSFLCLLGYVYFGAAFDGPHYLLIMGVGFALSGVAESLPKDRHHMAGVLRITAIGTIVAMLVLLAIAPEIINPR